MKVNHNYEILMKLDKNYTLLHNPNSSISPYNVVKGLKPDGSWNFGNYCSTLQEALITYLKLKGNPAIKSDYQLNVEKETLMNFDRIVELATLFKDGLEEDDLQSAYVYFTDICEMNNEELEFFGIDMPIKSEFDYDDDDDEDDYYDDDYDSDSDDDWDYDDDDDDF